jgi:hypothetical protein
MRNGATRSGGYCTSNFPFSPLETTVEPSSLPLGQGEVASAAGSAKPNRLEVGRSPLSRPMPHDPLYADSFRFCRSDRRPR